MVVTTASPRSLATSVVRAHTDCRFGSGINNTPPLCCSSSSSNQSIVVSKDECGRHWGWGSGEGGSAVRDDLVDAGDVEGCIIIKDGMRGVVVVESEVGAGAGVVGVGPGERAEVIELETPVKTHDARFWPLENLYRGRGE